MLLFVALSLIGVAVAGASAFVIFWPLSLVHLRECHPDTHKRLGESAFLAPRALGWLLSGQYRALPDRQLSGLATPARVALLCLLFALGMSGILWCLSQFI